MMNFFVLFTVCLAGCLAQNVLRHEKASNLSVPLDISFVKCSFVIFGEFDYEQASAACEQRNASLAAFSSLSEERMTLKKIDWRYMPGFEETKDGISKWLGQLWIAARRKSSDSDEWFWATSHGYNNLEKIKPRWIPDDPYENTTMVSLVPKDCAVIREDGWVPLSCSGYVMGSGQAARLAGALCNAFTFANPKRETTINFCNVPLVPYASHNIAIPSSIRKQYFLVQGNFTWSEARNVCLQKGGKFARVKTPMEREFVLKAVDLKSIGHVAWIALRRVAPKSIQFQWIDGSYIESRQGFLPGMPDFRYDCVSYDRNYQGLVGWTLRPCNGTESVYGLPMGALCETYGVA